MGVPYRDREMPPEGYLIGGPAEFSRMWLTSAFVELEAQDPNALVETRHLEVVPLPEVEWVEGYASPTADLEHDVNEEAIHTPYSLHKIWVARTKGMKRAAYRQQIETLEGGRFVVSQTPFQPKGQEAWPVDLLDELNLTISQRVWRLSWQLLGVDVKKRRYVLDREGRQLQKNLLPPLGFRRDATMLPEQRAWLRRHYRLPHLCECFCYGSKIVIEVWNKR